MAAPAQTSVKAKQFTIQGMMEHRVRTSLTVGIIVFLAIAAYGIFKPSQWEANQPLVVRAEALEGSNLPGRFDSDQQRRQVLDTLVAVLHSHPVLETTLREAGLEKPGRGFSFFRGSDIERLQRSLRVVPPSDTDFGTTDLIYLKVRDSKPERAIHLAQVLVKQADYHLRQILRAKAQATLQELTLAEKNAMEGLQTLTKELQSIEAQLGLDGLTLRSYEEKLDETSLRAAINDLEDKLAELDSQILTANELIRLLHQITVQTEKLCTIPSTLLENYPTLSHFQQSLREAEVKLIELRGQYGDDHPKMIAAQLALRDLAERLRDEIPTVIQTIENEQKVQLAQKQLLEERRQAEETRLAAILAMLPRYRELTTQVRSQWEAVRSTQQRLVIARAAAAAAESAELITPIEPPRTGNRPVGPEKITIAAGGLVFGAFLAFSLFLWLSPAVPHQTSEYVSSRDDSFVPPTPVSFRTAEEENWSRQTGTAPIPSVTIASGPRPVEPDFCKVEIRPSATGATASAATAQEQARSLNLGVQRAECPPDGTPTVPPPEIPIISEWGDSPLHQALVSNHRS
ncbi:MAG: GumC family protein [Thermogutta sp.]